MFLVTLILTKLNSCIQQSDRIPCDADVTKDEGKTEEELAEMMAEKEAKANTQLLEMVSWGVRFELISNWARLASNGKNLGP